MTTKLLAQAVGLATIFACTTVAPAWAQSITIAIGSEPSTLDPQLRDDGGERQVNDNIYETLMARTPTGDLVPGLAAAVPTQVDPTTWQFKLREGIKFHNGEPFNADAVVASVTRVIDPANNSEQMAYYGTIKGAEKVDDLTVNLVTNGPDPILPSRMYWMKMIAPGYSKDGDLSGAPVGTGPYKFESWNRGTDLTLVANSDYWGGEPQIDGVTYRFVTEPGTRLSGLLSGEFDVITNLLPEFTESVPKFAAVRSLETSVFVLGTDNEVTKDPKVRQALNLAIDRQSMVESLFMGYASDDRGDAASLQRQRHPVDHHRVAVGFAEVLDLDHRAAPLRTKRMKKMPPANSMTIESAVSKARSRSSTVCPPTRQTSEMNTAAGSTYRCFADGMTI